MAWSDKNLDRLGIATKRIPRILKRYIVANSRTLEQKISDAGPGDQRIDPHILTVARQALVKKDIVIPKTQGGIPWFYLSTANTDRVKERLNELDALHRQTSKQRLTGLIGQALEIAVYRALGDQDVLEYFGHFTDLDAHDDSTLYSKTEPPAQLSRRSIPGGKRFDFLVHHSGTSIYAGIEVKNIREWLYPDREEIREILFKSCSLDVVPVLIARRIHFSTFSVLNPCGVILHQSYNQLYPNSAAALAASVKDKKLLGYHDIRVGNAPDARLNKFLHVNLPLLLQEARTKFDKFKDLLWAYGNEDISYKSFAARVKRRMRGEPEDLPEPQEIYGEPEEPDEY